MIFNKDKLVVITATNIYQRDKLINKQPISLNHPLLGILVLFTLVALFNVPVLETLWRHGFDDGTYSHAFLIPFITLYLYYQLALVGQLNYRKKLSILPATFFVFSAVLLFITANAQISLGYWFSTLLLLISTITLLYKFNWNLIFPSVFLVFIIPFWGVFIPFLQDLSVAAVTYIMSFTGIPTYVEERYISIPAGVFEIAGGCSGLRYVIVSLTISSLYIFLYIKKLKQAAFFLLVAIVGALIANWIRITALILIGEYTNMESSLMQDHNTFGWYIYIPFMFLLFKWGNKLSDSDLIGDKPLMTPEVSSGLNMKILFTVVVGLALSSSSLKMINVEVTQQESEQTKDMPQPKVYFFTAKEKIPLLTKNIKSIYQIYHFSGSDLDGKPSYYQNKLIPNGWRMTRQEQQNKWQIYYISKGNKQAVVTVKYEIDNFSTSKIKTFKLKRLSKALFNINTTKLHWLFIECQQSCSPSISQVISL